MDNEMLRRAAGRSPYQAGGRAIIPFAIEEMDEGGLGAQQTGNNGVSLSVLKRGGEGGLLDAELERGRAARLCGRNRIRPARRNRDREREKKG